MQRPGGHPKAAAARHPRAHPPPVGGQLVSRPPLTQGPHEGQKPRRSVVPVGTLMLIAVLLLSIIWLWMLVLGIQQGRA